MRYNEKLKELRKKFQYTQIEMAEVLGVTQCSISIYERGDSYPSGRVLKKYIELAKKIKYPLKAEELIRG